MFLRQWTVLGAGLLISLKLAHGAQVGVAGDSFNLGELSYRQALESSGHSFRVLPDFSAASLQGLDAVWLDGFSTFTGGPLDLAAPSLEAFVRAGGTLLVQSPGFGLESADEFPFADGVIATTTASEATIRNMQVGGWLRAITDAQLSGWPTPEVSGHFTSIGTFTGLADNGTPGQWVTIGAFADNGPVIYTFQDISRLMFDPRAPDAIALLNSILPVPEPSTLALVALGGVALTWGGRRRLRR